jgi:hypothetical protein
LIFSRRFSERGERVAWILRLVKTSTDGEGPGTDLMEIRRPDGQIARAAMVFAA